MKHKLFVTKMITWSAFMICAACCLFSLIGIIFFYEEDFYDGTEAEYRREFYEFAAYNYSVRALHGYLSRDSQKNELVGLNFRYGIIEAESIDELNLNQESIYLERNFTEKISMESPQVYSCSFAVNDDTEFLYSNSLFEPNSYGTAVITHETKKSAVKNYFVVSILPKEEIGYGISGDLFMQANTVVSVVCGLRYSIYLIFAVSLVGGILLFWRMSVLAGKNGETQGVVIKGLNKLPLELYLAAASVAEIFMMLFVAAVMQELFHNYRIFCIVLSFLLILIIILIAAAVFLGIVVRIKKGVLWKNTIVYRICRVFRGAAELCVRHLSLVRKLMLFSGVYVIFQMLALLWIRSHRYIPFFIFLLCLLQTAVFVGFLIFMAIQMEQLQKGAERLASGDLKYQTDTSRMFWELKQHGENLNSIRDGMSRAVEERMRSEHFKTELITNVSHDIKTPLTSIINYVDLLEKEELNNKAAEEYLEVLKRQSARLKKLIEDLIEASKASTGNLSVTMEKLDAGVFLTQTVGEFEEKLTSADLELRIQKPDCPVYIMADSRHFWRVIDNLMNNICKYAQPQTRVYINIEEKEQKVMLIFRNTSLRELNIKSDELMERFVRGDSARHTEGNGLGLSIAASLMDLMQGQFDLQIDGDLFKVILTFDDCCNE